MKQSSVILILCLSLNCYGDSKCEKTLRACEDVIQAQDQAIDNLKKMVHNLNEQLAEEQSNIKWWQALIAGVLVGIVATKVSK